ncbi:MAG TPA: PAS domain S-box protein [Paludibacter sp.]
MIFLPFLHFLVFLVCLYLAVFVLYRDHKSILNQTTSVLMLCFALWNFGDIIIQNPDPTITESMVSVWQNIAAVGWLSFSSAILSFSLVFSNRENFLKKKWFLLLLILLPLFFLYKQFTNCLTVNPVRKPYGWSYEWADTIWTYLFFSYYFLFTLTSILLIYFHGRKTKKIHKKKQAKIIVSSISASLLVGTLFDVVIPELGKYSFPTIADLFVFVFALGLFYAIVKFRFLTITPSTASENIISSMDELLILLNKEGNILTVNKATLNSLQYQQNELLGKPVTMLLQENNMNKNILERITNEEVIKNNDINLQTKNGEIVPIIYSASPLRNEDGMILGTVFIARDITEHKQAELNLIKSENKYRLIAENTVDVIWSLDLNLKFTFLSPAILKLRGFTVEEAMNQTIDQVITPDSLLKTFKFFAEHVARIRSTLTAGTPSVTDEIKEKKDDSDLSARNQNPSPTSFLETIRLIAEYRALNKNMADYDPPSVVIELEQYKKDGSTIYTENSISILLDENKQPIGILGITRNIDERKLAEQELIKAKEKAEESDRLKSAFLANMSHEIRTPMNGILGFAEVLKDPDLTSEQQQEYIRIIEKSGARMLNIINDIVDISKIESGLMKLNLKESNINEQIEYIYTFFKSEVEAKGMELSFKNSMPAKEAIIVTDREKLYAILTNLVKNAIKYTPAGSIEFGYYLIESPTQLKELQFYAKDTGIGIPKDRQEAIFERFIQADIEDMQARQGAGLGLSITKAFVNMLGGKIWVESEVGIGSTFYFTLPYKVEPEETKVFGKVVSVQDEKNHIKNLKILIAEDDETSELLISITVNKFSKVVLKARTGNEAIEVCRINPDLDLILMDIQMPYLNGLEATRQIRQFNKNVVIIAQTAYGLSGDREKAIEAGCNDYISKPINKDELLSLIQKYFKK